VEHSFFSTPAAHAAIVRARASIEVLRSSNKKYSLLDTALSIVSTDGVNVDNFSQVNLKWGIGEAMLTALTQISSDPANVGAVDKLYSLLYRCFVEFDMSTQTDLNFDVRRFLQFPDDEPGEFGAEARESMAKAHQLLPTAVLKELLGTDAIQNLKNIKNYATKIDTRIVDWDKALAAQEERATILETTLKSYEDGFNFVGLYKGFSDLARSKKRELWVQRPLMVLMGLLTLAPIAAEGMFIRQHEAEIETYRWALLISAAPVISLTVLLVYFFRIAVRSADGAKSQLLQLELRKTLCQFIQSYVEYAGKHRSSNADSLSKFESVVFSGIVGSEEKMPATFDGIEQLTSLLKTVKGPA
jgi:hypothetical protein